MKLSEILKSDYELTALVGAAKARGISGSLIARLLKAAVTRDDAIAALQPLAGPMEHITKLPPLPAWVNERELDPHEAAIMEDMLSGRLKHFENGEPVLDDDCPTMSRRKEAVG